MPRAAASSRMPAASAANDAASPSPRRPRVRRRVLVVAVGVPVLVVWVLVSWASLRPLLDPADTANALDWSLAEDDRERLRQRADALAALTRDFRRLQGVWVEPAWNTNHPGPEAVTYAAIEFRGHQIVEFDLFPDGTPGQTRSQTLFRLDPGCRPREITWQDGRCHGVYRFDAGQLVLHYREGQRGVGCPSSFDDADARCRRWERPARTIAAAGAADDAG